MRPFDILDPNQNIHQNYLLEASAGTGKTFAIENLIVRLLIESKGPAPIPCLEELLVMTFTRAAARDLRDRIRGAIQLAIDALTAPNFVPTAPPYLESYFQNNTQNDARRRLQAALFNFSQASIFTIHSFCSQSLNNHLLEADIACHMHSQNDSGLTQHYLRQLVQDFLRTRVADGVYSAAELYTYGKSLRWDCSALENKLVKQISNRNCFEKPLSFLQLLERFQTSIQVLKNQGMHPEQLRHDFSKLAPVYKELFTRSKQLKPAIEHALESFCDIFEAETPSQKNLEAFYLHGCPFLDYLQPENLKSKAKPPIDELMQPTLLKNLEGSLSPILEELTLEKFEAKLFHDCQEHVIHHLKEEELMRHDDLLYAMQEASQQEAFSTAIKRRYKAVIVDEFQDTDPLQWQIFKNLFLSESNRWSGYLYLVGDPKQSIYAFRKADIYTYLDAQGFFSSQSLGTLNTNFRSEGPLLEALNALFDSARVPRLIHLPKREVNLPYQPVQAGVKEQTGWHDGKGSLHVLIATEENLKTDAADRHYFVPFFANEAQLLKQNYGIPYQRMAILVSDRYQAHSAAEQLRRYGLPCIEQKCSSLADSSALTALQEVLRAILSPRNESLLKQALGNKLFGFSYEQMLALSEPQFKVKTLAQLMRLRKIWREEGFSSLFFAILQEMQGGFSIAERLLNESKEGEDFYCDLQQLADILIAHQSETRCSPEKLLFFLETLTERSDEDDDRLKRRADSTQEAISILTIHSSKGLEYDIVFPIGLHRAGKEIKGLIPTGEQGILTALKPTDPRYQLYQQELEAESLRLFYVALTRAKKRLYFPLVQSAKKRNRSPNDLYLEAFKYPPLSGEEGFLKFIEEMGSSVSITREVLSPDLTPLISNHPIGFIELHAPPPVPEAPKPKLMHSYTSLAKTSANLLLTAIPTPKDFHTDKKTVHTLPVGAETGICLHRLLQLLPFDIPSCEEMELWLKRHLSQAPFKEWAGVIAQLLFQALNRPLPGSDGSFCLSQISSETLYRECEFFFTPDSTTAANFEISGNSFLRGTIDLLFMHEGYYYLLDWKSNWLGPDESFYAEEQLLQAAEQNGYLLQAELYRQALKQYLANVEPRPFEECFGGYYLVFLRGLKGGNGILVLPSKTGCLIR